MRLLHNIRNFFYPDGYTGKTYHPGTNFYPITTVDQRVKVALSNPAMLKVIALQCDTFSLGKCYVYRGEKAVEKDPLLDLLKRPNPFSATPEFLWEYMFWVMIGNAYLYVDSAVVDKLSGNKLYFLDPRKIEWPLELENNSDKLVLSNAETNRLLNLNIVYRYSDGTSISIPLRKIIHISDMPGRFMGPSRMDALYKVIGNSEAALDSNNINLRHSGKFMIAGKTDINDVNKLPLHEDEKRDIEDKINSDKPVHAVKSMIDIKRFVENAANLKLDDAYLNAYFLIGAAYNIPKDVLEAFNSGTFENQEKARGAHVTYSLQPKGDALLDALSNHFGYTNLRGLIDWEHLPFMQVFREQRARANLVTAQAVRTLQSSGISMKDINSFLDTEFDETETNTAAGQEAQGQQSNQPNSNQR